MNKDKIRQRSFEEEDFINSAKHGFSLEKLLKVRDEELENKQIAKLLGLSEQEVSDIYESAIKKLREFMEE